MNRFSNYAFLGMGVKHNYYTKIVKKPTTDNNIYKVELQDGRVATFEEKDDEYYSEDFNMHINKNNENIELIDSMGNMLSFKLDENYPYMLTTSKNVEYHMEMNDEYLRIENPDNYYIEVTREKLTEFEVHFYKTKEKTDILISSAIVKMNGNDLNEVTCYEYDNSRKGIIVASLKININQSTIEIINTIKKERVKYFINEQNKIEKIYQSTEEEYGNKLVTLISYDEDTVEFKGPYNEYKKIKYDQNNNLEMERDEVYLSKAYKYDEKNRLIYTSDVIKSIESEAKKRGNILTNGFFSQGLEGIIYNKIDVSLIDILSDLGGKGIRIKENEDGDSGKVIIDTSYKGKENENYTFLYYLKTYGTSQGTIGIELIENNIVKQTIEEEIRNTKKSEWYLKSIIFTANTSFDKIRIRISTINYEDIIDIASIQLYNYILGSYLTCNSEGLVERMINYNKEVKYSYTYNKRNYNLSKKETTNKTKEYKTDEKNNVTEVYEIDSLNAIVKNSYDENNNLIERTKSYDSIYTIQKNEYEEGYIKRNENELGIITEYNYEKNNGKLLSKTSDNKKIEYMYILNSFNNGYKLYDSNNNLIDLGYVLLDEKEFLKNCYNRISVFEYTYDDFNNLIKITTQKIGTDEKDIITLEEMTYLHETRDDVVICLPIIETVKTLENNTYKYEYDENYNLKRIKYQEANQTKFITLQEYEYDVNKQVKQINNYLLKSPGGLPLIEETIDITYDYRNRVKDIISSKGVKETNGYEDDTLAIKTTKFNDQEEIEVMSSEEVSTISFYNSVKRSDEENPIYSSFFDGSYMATCAVNGQTKGLAYQTNLIGIKTSGLLNYIKLERNNILIYKLDKVDMTNKRMIVVGCNFRVNKENPTMNIFSICQDQEEIEPKIVNNSILSARLNSGKLYIDIKNKNGALNIITTNLGIINNEWNFVSLAYGYREDEGSKKEEYFDVTLNGRVKRFNGLNLPKIFDVIFNDKASVKFKGELGYEIDITSVYITYNNTNTSTSLVNKMNELYLRTIYELIGYEEDKEVENYNQFQTNKNITNKYFLDSTKNYVLIPLNDSFLTNKEDIVINNNYNKISHFCFDGKIKKKALYVIEPNMSYNIPLGKEYSISLNINYQVFEIESTIIELNDSNNNRIRIVKNENNEIEIYINTTKYLTKAKLEQNQWTNIIFTSKFIKNPTSNPDYNYISLIINGETLFSTSLNRNYDINKLFLLNSTSKENDCTHKIEGILIKNGLFETQEINEINSKRGNLSITRNYSSHGLLSSETISLKESLIEKTYVPFYKLGDEGKPGIRILPTINLEGIELLKDNKSYIIDYDYEKTSNNSLKNNLLKSYKITLTDNTKSEDTIEENKEYTYYLNNAIEKDLITSKEIKYTYDEGGNISSITNNNKTENFIYDEKNRLIKVGQKIIKYKSENSLYPSEYGIYMNGNLMAGMKYTWEEKRLVKVNNLMNEEIKYSYDSTGKRTKKELPTKTINYYYTTNNLLSETHSDGTIIRYIYENNNIIGFKLKKNNETKSYLYMKDMLSNIIGIINEEGKIVTRYSYTAYGKVTIKEYSEEQIGEINPIRYKGYYYDSETLMYYLMTRYLT